MQVWDEKQKICWKDVPLSRTVVHDANGSKPTTNEDYFLVDGKEIEDDRGPIHTHEASVTGLALPIWNDVKNREYHPWSHESIMIDTAVKTSEESLSELIARVNSYKIGTHYKFLTDRQSKNRN